MNDLSCGIRMLAQGSSVSSQITRLTDGRTDRQTDGTTAFSWLYRALHYIQSHGKKLTNSVSVTNPDPNRKFVPSFFYTEVVLATGMSANTLAVAEHFDELSDA